MFRRYLSREIKKWTESGLLSPGQAELLMADHDRRHTGFSLSAVLAVLAAVLFGAAVIALVAANWEFIPRLMRVILVIVLILGALGIAVWSLRRDARWIAEAALIFTLLCYGAGIALVGQMYHLSGDEAQFLLTWITGALVVSLCFSSAITAAGAGLIGFGYFFAVSTPFTSSATDAAGFGDYGLVLAFALLVGLAAWRSRSLIAGHLSALLLVAWLLWLVDDATPLEPFHVLAALGAVAFAIGSFGRSAFGGVVERHGMVSGYGAILLLSGLGWAQLDLADTGLAGEMAVAAVILIFSVVALAVAGRENLLVRRFAYFSFACETIYVVSETLGSLLGSSWFLFLGGLVLAIIAYAVMKIEKRFKAGRDLS